MDFYTILSSLDQPRGPLMVNHLQFLLAGDPGGQLPVNNSTFLCLEIFQCQEKLTLEEKAK